MSKRMTGPDGARGRGQRWLGRMLGCARRSSPAVAGLIVAAQLLACVAVTLALGGAGKVAPHWFYLPIVWAGARLGVPGAVATSLAAGVLAGPLMPESPNRQPTG